jgi:two-component system phosphate regulon response regulator PhoB|tara:strand:+ start:362 stop:1060 length:699 start_codon:yes stop_codon:yes gene_type:complete
MSHHILVVEDEPDINKTVSYNIANEGLKPLSALNLTEAESYISSNNISLIILDLMLPDGSGLDFCKKLKSSNAYSDIPIIIVTAKDDEVDKVVGFELGADDYVTKPFSVRELMLRIKAILKRNSKDMTQNTSSKIETFGILSINEDSHEVFINDDEIILTALEFKLLKHLLDRRGRVQTRDQLLSDVWGYSAHITTRTVDTHVKRLREKMGVMGKHVQTIRGVGYRFSRNPD